ncbi:hypothetical protein F4808DRAFT_410870 [Astrocystis sublimbata]|nr:hypothetical protein F4808DRAFT_410870 [Astrocystis sublimbata]
MKDSTARVGLVFFITEFTRLPTMASYLSPDLIDKLRNSPAAKPPPGTIVDFTNPPDRTRLAFWVIGASVVVASSAGLLRFYSKIFCTGRNMLHVEDYLGLASFPFFFASTWALCKIPDDAGFFIHQWNLLFKDLEEFLYFYILSTTFNCITLLLTKVAILLEYTRIFVARPHRNKFYWVCYVMIICNTILYIATILVIIFACRPRDRFWRQYLPGKCIDVNIFNVLITSLHLINDMLILILPQTVIWRLLLTKKQKLGLSVVFSVGALACICAGGRVASAIRLYNSNDASYELSNHIMWGIAEVTTAVLVFCAPSFPAIFRESSPLNRFFAFFKPQGMTRQFRESGSANGNRLKSLPTPDPPLLTRPSPVHVHDNNGSSSSLTDHWHARVESPGHVLDKPEPGRILVSTEIEVIITSEPQRSQTTMPESARPSW